MTTFAIKCLTLLFVLIFVIKLYIIYYERRLLFFPVRQVNQTPADIGLAYEWRRFLSYDGHQLTGWWIRRDNPIATVLFFHGNAGNIGDRIQFLNYLYEAGFSVFVFDYRGYGESEGRPSEQGLLIDGDAAYEELTTQIGIPPEQIIFFGRSLGGVIAAHTARGRPIRGLIVEGTFPSANDMAEVIFAPIKIPRSLIGVNLDSLSCLKRRKCPVLIIHGTHDEVVPFRMGQKLYEMTDPPKSFYVVDRGGHNDCYMVGTKDYFEKIRAFAVDPSKVTGPG